MLRDRAYAAAAALTRRPRLFVALVVLVLAATQGAVAESGEFVISPMEEGNVDMGSDGNS